MITASIVAYKNKIEDIVKVVECARRSAIDKVYIVDHANDDALKNRFVGDAFVDYATHANLGYGSGHNVAIRRAMAAGADYHVVLNPDIYWDCDIISPMVEYMDHNQDVGQMIPKVYYPNGETQTVARLCPAPMDLIAKRFLPEWMMRKRLARFGLEFAGKNQTINAPYLYGCFMLFRVDALRDVGIFDERFFMYPEDIDITRRIHAKYKTLFFPEVSIVHAHAAASRKNLKMLWIHITNMIKYFNKWGWVHDPERKEYNRRLLSSLGLGD